MPKFTPISVRDLGEYLRDERHLAKLSLRQLSEAAGISNPYISQIERGLKKPSAEILQALAKALRISAESLYVRAGILDERIDLGGDRPVDVTEAVLADPKLNDRQRAVLLDVYESFVGEPEASKPARASKLARSTKPAKPTTAAKPAKSARPTKSTEPTRAPSAELRLPAPAQTPDPLIPEPLTQEQKQNPSAVQPKEKKS